MTIAKWFLESWLAAMREEKELVLVLKTYRMHGELAVVRLDYLAELLEGQGGERDV